MAFTVSALAQTHAQSLARGDFGAPGRLLQALGSQGAAAGHEQPSFPRTVASPEAQTLSSGGQVIGSEEQAHECGSRCSSEAQPSSVHVLVQRVPLHTTGPSAGFVFWEPSAHGAGAH